MGQNIYGVDIGTSNFKMCCKDKDKIINEKNIIAIANKKDILAFGDEAYEMYEKAPEHIEVSLPVKFGCYHAVLKICRHCFFVSSTK